MRILLRDSFHITQIDARGQELKKSFTWRPFQQSSKHWLVQASAAEPVKISHKSFLPRTNQQESPEAMQYHWHQCMQRTVNQAWFIQKADDLGCRWRIIVLCTLSSTKKHLLILQFQKLGKVCIRKGLIESAEFAADAEGRLSSCISCPKMIRCVGIQKSSVG